MTQNNDAHRDTYPDEHLQYRRHRQQTYIALHDTEDCDDDRIPDCFAFKQVHLASSAVMRVVSAVMMACCSWMKEIRFAMTSDEDG